MDSFKETNMFNDVVNFLWQAEGCMEGLTITAYIVGAIFLLVLAI